MAFIHMYLQSQCLMRTVSVDVILPSDKMQRPGMPAAENKPFRTLYLLHGMFGNEGDWTHYTNIRRYAEDMDICVVMPSGENAYYLDQEASREQYGRFVGQELVEQTRKMFHLSERPEDTWIAGLSMGGYGALRNGLKYNGTFGYIGGFSVANIVDDLDTLKDGAPFALGDRRYIANLLGDLDKALGTDRSIEWLATQLSEAGQPLPKLYIACGLSDPFLPRNRRLRDHLSGCCFELSYTETPGGHEWDFWDAQIKAFLELTTAQ